MRHWKKLIKRSRSKKNNNAAVSDRSLCKADGPHIHCRSAGCKDSGNGAEGKCWQDGRSICLSLSAGYPDAGAGRRDFQRSSGSDKTCRENAFRIHGVTEDGKIKVVIS